jgi:hypothetical protein
MYQVLPAGIFMLYHISSSSTQLWRIIKDEYKPHVPKNLSPREVVENQINAFALFIIQKFLTLEKMVHIRPLATAKEAWNHLTNVFIGNASIQSSRL